MNCGCCSDCDACFHHAPKAKIDSTFNGIAKAEDNEYDGPEDDTPLHVLALAWMLALAFGLGTWAVVIWGVIKLFKRL